MFDIWLTRQKICQITVIWGIHLQYSYSRRRRRHRPPPPPTAAAANATAAPGSPNNTSHASFLSVRKRVEQILNNYKAVFSSVGQQFRDLWTGKNNNFSKNYIYLGANKYSETHKPYICAYLMTNSSYWNTQIPIPVAG